MNNLHKKIEKCLSCFECLSENNTLYHTHCAKKLFDKLEPPTIDFSQNDIEKLALNFLNERIALTGVQKKLSLKIKNENDTNRLKSRLTIVGALGGEYILKPSTPEYPYMAELECLTMRLAEICEIQVAPFGLIFLKDESIAYITKRFDRIGGKKLACEDLCQLSELLTEQKYKSTAEKTGKIIKKYSSFPGDDLLRYFELTAFSFLTGNADMHLKNFSLLTDLKGKIKVSPAYDLLSTRLLIPLKEDNEELVLSVNGKKSNLKRKDFNLFAKTLKIPEKSANFVLDKMLQKRNILIETIKKSFLPEKIQEDYIKLIKEREKRLT